MSLTSVNLLELVKKQYVYKLKANIDAFSSLVGIQLLGMLFSFNGVSSSGMGSESININVKYYSSDLVIAFTMLWAFVTAITITTKPLRHNDFTFVTNRLSSSLSNGFFLLTASIIGAITAMLASYLLQAVAYILFDLQVYNYSISAGELILGIMVTILYVFFASSIGYLVGTLVQVSKLFIGLIPVLIFGSLFLEVFMQGEPILAWAYRFYFTEPSLLLFTIKIMFTTAIFFIASLSILNRMEVRR